MRFAFVCGAAAAFAATMASASAQPSAFRIVGRPARDIARSTSVVRTLEAIVGLPPSDLGLLAPREVRERWYKTRLDDSGVKKQIDALLASRDARSYDSSAANVLARRTVDDSTCGDFQVDSLSIFGSVAQTNCDDIFTTCHQSCSRGLWHKPTPGTCQLVCGMARERCQRCSFQRQKSFVRKILERISSSCAALVMWILPHWWLSLHDWTIVVIALIPGFLQAMITHWKLKHMLKHISDAELAREIQAAFERTLHEGQDKAVQANMAQEEQQVDAMGSIPHLSNALPPAEDEIGSRSGTLSTSGSRSSAPASPLSSSASAGCDEAQVTEAMDSNLVVRESSIQRRVRRSHRGMSVYEYVSRARGTDE